MSVPFRSLRIVLVIGVTSVALVGGGLALRGTSNNTSTGPTPPRMSCKEPPSSAHTPGNEDLKLTLSKNVAHPGEVLTLAIISPQSIQGTRGITSYLECWDGGQWVPEFVLISGSEGHPPSSVPVDQHPVIPDMGFSLNQPEQIKVPKNIPAGFYRITKTVVITPEGATNQPRTLHAPLQVNEHPSGR